MPDEPQPGPDDDFQEMLRKLLSGEGQIDPSQLAGAAGLPNDPASVANLMSQLQRAAQSGGDGIDFSATAERATAIARDGGHPVDPATSQAADQAFQVAALWLDEVTTVAELTATPSLYTREQWAKATIPVWTQIAEPVAFSIADALTEAIDQRAPEQLKAMLGDVSKAMRGIGGALFAIQLGQVVGQLSKEVVSGGDVGVPLLDEQVAALLPQNVAEFAEGLDVSEDEVRIYLAVRELAHARLFRLGTVAPAAHHLVDHGLRTGHPHPLRPRRGTRGRHRPDQPGAAARRARVAVPSSRRAPTSRTPHSPASRRCSRWSRAGSTRSPLLPPHVSRSPGRSPRWCAVAVRPAARPSRRSPPSSASSCGRAVCVRPRRCGSA